MPKSKKSAQKGRVKLHTNLKEETYNDLYEISQEEDLPIAILIRQAVIDFIEQKKRDQKYNDK